MFSQVTIPIDNKELNLNMTDLAGKTLKVVNNAIGGGATQSITDRLAAAKYSIAGQGLAKAVAKATTEEVIAPKRKHVEYLTQCTHEPNISIPSMADLLMDRTKHANWVVVFKSLTTIHSLMNFGNERFTQYLASNNYNLNLASFTDKQSAQGYDMSTFIRRYARYINQKATSYRLMAFDFCKALLRGIIIISAFLIQIKRGKEEGILRQMSNENLLKALPALQDQVDALLEFDAQANELSNAVVSAAFMLLFKDLIRLFACYNDGIINLLEKFFEMPKKQAKEALDIYKKFLVRMDQVQDFFKTAEKVGVDRGDIPDLTRAPASLLEALEAHLAQLEGRKRGDKPVAPPIRAADFAAEAEKQRILEEERAELEKYEKSVEQKSAAPPPSRPPAPAQQPPAAAAAPAQAAATSSFDFFSFDEAAAANPQQAAKTDIFSDVMAAYDKPNPSQPVFQANFGANNPFALPATGGGGGAAPFAPNFDNAFSGVSPAAATQSVNPFLTDAFGGGGSAFGAQPIAPANKQMSPSNSNPLVTASSGANIDVALTSLVDNLNIKTAQQPAAAQQPINWQQQPPPNATNQFM